MEQATMDPPETTAPPDQWDELADGWHDVPMADYLSWPLVSASLIRDLRTRTPAYVRWCMTTGGVDDQTASTHLGSLTHSAIFEPDKLEAEYVAEPEPDPTVFLTAKGEPSKNPRATAEFKAAVAELEATGRSVVTADDWRNALAMREAVHGHPRARQLLAADGPVEISGIVTDPETGVRCKIRPDKLVPAIGADVNLKTTRNARWDRFIHDAFKFGYFVSLAFYRRLLPELDFDWRRAIIIAVESDGFPAVATYEYDEGAMDAGEQLVDKYLRQIAHCMERDAWPAHPADIQPLSLPEYGWTRVDEEIVS